MSKRFITFTVCAVLFVVGCESDRSITETKPLTALVRFINATARDTVDVATGGAVSTANDSLLFGQSTGCLIVTPATPGLSFRKSGTTTDLTGFTPTFEAGHEYWVVAITGASGSQFVQLDQAFTPTTATTDNGLVGLNAVNGGGPYDLHVAVPATALSSATLKISALAFGVPSAFVNNTIPFNTATPPVAQPLQLQFTNAGTFTVARNHGNVTMVPNTSGLAIVGPSAAGSTALRSVFNAGC